MKKSKKLEFSFILAVLAVIFCFSGPSPAASPARITADIDELEVPRDKEIVLEVYSVQENDSLAEIARRRYGDWKKWDLIYRYNDYINDPHWIFPGDKIIVPKVVSKLPRVPEVKEVRPEPDKEEVAEVREYGDFLAPEDFVFDGRVSGFTEHKEMPAFGDYCFINLGSRDGLSEGQKFNIYRPGRGVADPDTGELMGVMMKKVGALRVTGNIEERSATARITMSHNFIRERDLLLAFE